MKTSSIKAIDLNEEERNEFTEWFYFNWNDKDLESSPDVSSELPFGCPWLYNQDCKLKGETIEEMALNYFNSVKEEIIRVIKESKKNEE
jgi:hypothetical protein